MQKQNNIEEIIKRLGIITESIEKIYNQLSNEENEENIKKLNTNLKFVLEIEDELYDSIFRHKDYDKSILIKIPGIIYSLNLKNPKQIIARICNYITQVDYINPFASTLKDSTKKQQEDYICIKYQSILDLYQNIQMTLDNIINNTSSKKERTSAKNFKNALFFSIKTLNSFISSSKSSKLYGKERCILFGHDEKTVNKIYLTHIYDKINQSIINILLLGNSLKDKVILESALNMLSKNEVFQIVKEYYQLTNKNYPDLAINPNNTIITEILRDRISGIILNSLEYKENKPIK